MKVKSAAHRHLSSIKSKLCLGDLIVTASFTIFSFLIISERAVIYFGVSALISQGRIFESMIVLVYFVTIGIYLLHRLNRGELLSGEIVRVLRVDSEDEAIESIADKYPIKLTAILLLGISIVFFIEFSITNVSDQSYGLLFDGIGGVLLASDVYFAEHKMAGGDLSITGTEADQKATVYSFWGLIMLSFGFFLQFLSTLPWELMFSTLTTF